MKIIKCLLWFALILVALVALVVVLSVLRIPSQQEYERYSLPQGMSVLEQNWNEDIREQVHFTSMGSKMLPYSLFLNLELPDSSTLLSDNSVLDRLGFIVQKPGGNNPDGLPIGFAKETKSGEQAWVGLTCAACHTGMLSYSGQKIIVDGGPGMLDFNGFEALILTSLRAAIGKPVKFNTLHSRMKELSEQDLKGVLQERIAFFEQRIAINQVDVAYGYGRLDAFGRIFNAVATTALDLPENRHSPNAPVSIPMLWDAAHLNLVQWNGSMPNSSAPPLTQNVPTALAVYGQIDMDVPSRTGYSSSVDITNLGYIQSQWYKLNAPKWPEKVFGNIDSEKAARGKAVYQQRCIECHAVHGYEDPERKLRVKVIEQNLVQTDPMMASNFATLSSSSGPLQGQKTLFFNNEKFAKEAQTLDFVSNATVGVLLRRPLDTLSAIIAEYRSVYKAQMNKTRIAYKARSLNGVWATGPFLHNGSVPTIYDLLQSVDKRPSYFYVGSREMDTVKLGLVHNKTLNSSYFDTRLPGNSNAGHEFAVDLSEQERWELIEYLKTL